MSTDPGLQTDQACLAFLQCPAGQHGFFDGTRFPSDRRPVRVANLQLALDAFARAGLPLQVCLWPRCLGACTCARVCCCCSICRFALNPLRDVSTVYGACPSSQVHTILLQGAPRSATRGGGQAPLAAGDLVDGDREMTLCLLWRLILHFQLPQLISLAAIRAEVELVQAKAPAAAGCTDLQPTLLADVATDACSPHVAALLSWVQAVCAHYGLPVRAFGACFGDGSAFCLLVGWAAARLCCCAEGWQADIACGPPWSLRRASSPPPSDTPLPGPLVHRVERRVPHCAVSRCSRQQRR